MCSNVGSSVTVRVFIVSHLRLVLLAAAATMEMSVEFAFSPLTDRVFSVVLLMV